MKHFTRHKLSGARAERSIFGTIFKAMVGVLLVEVALLVASIYAMRVGPQLDQNAEDILAMQVENRSRYIQTTLHDAQELSTLESEINTLTQELLASGSIDLDKSSSLIGKLVETTNSVTGSMQEITTASGMNANSIEEQNTMTATIQDAIEETSERSKQMVDIAMNSNDSIQENMRVMDALKDQAEQITNTNHDVTEAMTKLQDKTKEVEEIAGMILNISSQTNLLALNASIESARAGEAGRGFAVVAEQIRQLAEQTKNSTEEITRITNELNANANDVVVSVEGSVQATEDQKEKILAASETFNLLNKNIGELVAHIEEVNKKVSGLSDSNNKIVVNCSQLSAATEEVTASAEQVHTLSEENLDVAKQVQNAVEKIHSTADDIKKFLH